MPIYKALILNKEISVNYDENQKDELIEAINTINTKLESYKNLHVKVSDSKLLSFLAIKLQAEILDLYKNKVTKNNLEKKIEDSNNENINLNDKLYQLREQNKSLVKKNELLNQELIQIESQIDIITNLIKKTYEE